MKLIENKVNVKPRKKYIWEQGKKMELTPSICALQIQSCYKRWKDIYTNGCNDPFWCDGTNLNLIRNHVEYYRRMVEELLGDEFSLYPEEYFWCDLPQLDYNYMAKVRWLVSENKYIVASEKEYEVTF